MRSATFMLVTALSVGCTATSTPKAPSTPCQLVFDAGSTGTRLHVITHEGAAWNAKRVDLEGPPLARPARELGDSYTSALTATARAISMLADDKILASCRVESADVLATAGMRLVDAPRAKETHRVMAQELSRRVGVPARSRTITGKEEAIYAWVSEGQLDAGLIELGGASMQVAFPCADCEDAERVTIDGQAVPLVAYSELGVGTNEAFDSREACAYGAGLDPAWEPTQCSMGFELEWADYLGVQRHQGPWVVAGALAHWAPEQVDQCCYSKGDCYDAETSCHRALYAADLASFVGIVIADADTASGSWPLGFARCEAQRCLD